MTDTKGGHTPGPWTIEEYGDDDTPTLVIHKDSETRVCFMATPGSHGDPARIEADAHLIAASPIMLKALVHVEAVMTIVPPRTATAEYLAALKDIRAAIAKATPLPQSDGFAVVKVTHTTRKPFVFEDEPDTPQRESKG